MRIAIVIFGIPRGSEITQPSIIKNIVKPAETVGDVALFGHLFLQDTIVNPRSGESGQLAESDYKRFSEFSPIVERPMDVLEQWNAYDLFKFGDIYNDNFKSVCNLFHQLHSLYSATVQIEDYVPDVVIFARPDLLYHEPLNRHQIISVQRKPKRIYLPQWQWWNGYNDRFAICGRSAYKIYGRRIELARNYCISENSPLHAEKLLRFVLIKNNLSIRTMLQSASRVRVSNYVKEECFDVNKTTGRDSRKLFIELRTLQFLSLLRL